MTRRIIASLAAVGVAILASCSQDQRQSALLPTEAALAKPSATPTCSPSAIGTDAKNYFTNTTGASKDEVFALIDVMQKAYIAGGKDGATSAGFDVLRRYGDAAGTDAIKPAATATETAAQLSLAANHVMLCMTVPGFTYSEGQFTDAFLPTGLFAVRTSSENVPVLAKSGRFGAEPTSGNWPLSGSTTGKALFHGFPLTQNTLKKDPLYSTGFDLKSKPSPLVFSPKIRVGVCDLPNLASSDKARILHVHGPLAAQVAAVLPQDPPTFCLASYTSAKASRSVFAFAAQRLASWLAPAPAYAVSRSLMPLVTKVGGGTVGGLSEIGPVVVQDTIIIDRIRNSSVSRAQFGLDSDTLTSQFDPVVRLQALSKIGKNPLVGVTINLMVVGNQGSYFADHGTAVTDSQGYARFPEFYVDKAGGYTITAKAADAEFGADSFVATSNLFNISGQ